MTFSPSYAVSYDSLKSLGFCGSGSGVYIMDLADPTNPQKISEGIHTRGVVEDFSTIITIQHFLSQLDADLRYDM